MWFVRQALLDSISLKGAVKVLIDLCASFRKDPHHMSYRLRGVKHHGVASGHILSSIGRQNLNSISMKGGHKRFHSSGSCYHGQTGGGAQSASVSLALSAPHTSGECSNTIKNRRAGCRDGAKESGLKATRSTAEEFDKQRDTVAGRHLNAHRGASDVDVHVRARVVLGEVVRDEHASSR